MITADEERFVSTHAYVPEHLPGYVVAISRSEPHLLDDYLCYRGEDSLVFVGYPLRSPIDEKALMGALKQAVSRFKPEHVTLTAPAMPLPRDGCLTYGSDHYYKLELSAPGPCSKVRNMIRRASRELHVESGGSLEDAHLRLIGEFLDSRHVSTDARSIFQGVPAYVSSVSTVRVLSAWNARGDLVAFDVADVGARACAFYQFNFVSRTHYLPGASDLLLHELIETARQHGKSFINLGLGINAGVARFKAKWGAAPFLAHQLCRYQVRLPRAFDALLGKL